MLFDFPILKSFVFYSLLPKKTRTVSAGTGFEMIYKNIAIELKV